MTLITMAYFHHWKIFRGLLPYSVLRTQHLRCLSTSEALFAQIVTQKQVEEIEDKDSLPDVIRYISDRRIIYSSYIQNQGAQLSFSQKVKVEKIAMSKQKMIRRKKFVPLIIEKMMSQSESEMQSLEQENSSVVDSVSAFPYSQPSKMYSNDIENVERGLIEDDDNEDFSSPSMSVREDTAYRMLAYDEGRLEHKHMKSHLEKEEALELKDLGEDPREFQGLSSPRIQYGTPDRSIPVSKVPCGGCGANLHCQEPAFPGYVPKEMFVGRNSGELRNVQCQRCYFLKYHKMALNVRVSPEEYPKILESIRTEKALIVVVVDLLDIPCSIWPNLIDLIGTRRPIVVVGNKVDLLPADGKNHLLRVTDSLIAALEQSGLTQMYIRHIALVSARTGFGIESLITKIQKYWGRKGDMYILGCTNTGKSTLFNALLGSDLCKTEASDLIVRATTSPWPGTTLNMLKFPMLNPTGLRLHQRTERLRELERIKNMEDKLKPRYTKNISTATLSDRIGRTFSYKEVEEKKDPFSTNVASVSEERNILGINPKNPKYSEGRWCYDTPGTVQPDQIINLLSHDELMKVLPRRLIQPCTFSLRRGKSLFIGGLARLDLLYCPQSVRFTVFTSKHVPITIVNTVDASAFYRDYVGSTLLGVPHGTTERLKHWPSLEPRNMRMYGVCVTQSCADVVLSSAGWIAITADNDDVVEVRGWTPEGRGIYLRDPPMLPHAVTLKGDRVRKSLAFKPHRIYVPR